MTLSETGERLAVHGSRIGLVALLLLLWQLAPGRWVDPMILGYPADAWRKLLDWLEDGTLLDSVLATLEVVAIGFAAGAAAGTAAGLATALSRTVFWCIDPLLTVLFALPKIALVPLFIIWFGLDETERTVFTATVVFFLIQASVHKGARAVPAALDNSLKLLGATLWQRLRVLYLPGCAGWLIAGSRVAVPYAFLSAIGAEVIGSQEGLGHLIKASAFSMDPDGMMTAVLVLIALSLLGTAAADALGRVSRWRF